MIFFTQGALLIILFIVGIIWIRRRNRDNAKLPPGPNGLPLIGNLHQLISKNPYQRLTDFASKYGPIYTIYLGTKRAFIISDVKLLKQIFGKLESCGKHPIITVDSLTNGEHGIIGLEGKQCLEQREFCLKNLKEFGLEKLEPLMLEEIKDLVDWIKLEGTAEKAIDLQDVLPMAIVNSIWTIMCGERLCWRESPITYLMSDIMKAMQASVKSGLVVLPWLKYVAPELSGFNALQRAGKNVHEFIASQVEEHKKSYVPGIRRDLIDCYIQGLEDAKNNPSSSFHGPDGILNAVSSLVVLFVGGGETSASTLVLMFFYLCQNPNVQKKIHGEIDRVIGKDRDPTLADRSNLPYLEAVILETLRYSSLAPIGNVHRLMGDIQTENYFLPKDSIILGNLFAAHYNRQTWKDPKNFRPERFLEPGNKKLREMVIPFHVGKRSCPGENHAKETLFLFSAKLLQTFIVKPDPAHTKEDYMEPEIAYMLLPKHSKIIMTPRN